MEKRSKIIFKLLAAAFAFLLAVMLKIIVIDKMKYTLAASEQHLVKTKVKIYRGMIYDRNLIPLVDCRSYILGINGEDGKNMRYNITKRYDERSLARHLVGYVDSKSEGVSGVEKRYNDYLSLSGSYVISEINDVNQKRIKNLPETVKNDGNQQSGICLTLDYHVQKAVENAFDNSKKTGAAVVLDVKNFDVLAMASRPNFDQNNIEKYINGGGSELINRAVSEYNAGSIFKIITASSALENGIAKGGDLFWCGGFENIDGKNFGCNKKEGHKNLNFYDAFANSCNVCFYDLAILEGSDRLCDMAKKFGLGEKVIGLEGEKSGNIEIGTTRCDMANAAIGQGKILITPVQAAKTAAIIASGGVSRNVNIVKQEVDQNGCDKRSLYYESEKRVISRESADVVKDMMYLAVSSGTGRAAYDEKIKICGKTGSAQTGWISEGSLMVHGWFVGFFPYDNPKYAMAVFLENGQSGAEAAKIFLDIAREIEE